MTCHLPHSFFMQVPQPLMPEIDISCLGTYRGGRWRTDVQEVETSRGALPCDDLDSLTPDVDVFGEEVNLGMVARFIADLANRD